MPTLLEAVLGRHVVIYNAEFDTGFMPGVIREAAEISCCMLHFAEEYGDYNDYHWQSPRLRAMSDTTGRAAPTEHAVML